MKTKRRIYLNSVVLTPGAEIALSADHAHYLTSVLRLEVGAEVYVFNAEYGEFRSEITAARKQAASVKLIAQTRAPQPSQQKLTLVFAPLKKDRTDFLVEKASELGAHMLQPIFTDHTQSERVNIQRLQMTAIEAAEQCDRLDAPQVLPAQKLSAYLAALPKEATIFLAAESGDAASIAEAFAELLPDAGNIHFIIGPEGGFSAAEFDAFTRIKQIRPVRLGPRLLRAETAAIAVLSAFQAAAGDWVNI